MSECTRPTNKAFPDCGNCENRECRALPFDERLERSATTRRRLREEAAERIGWTGGLDE